MFIPKLNHNHTISILKFSFIHPSSSLLTHCLHSPLQNPPQPPCCRHRRQWLNPLSPPLLRWARPYTNSKQSSLPFPSISSSSSLFICCYHRCRGGVVTAGDIATPLHILDYTKTHPPFISSLSPRHSLPPLCSSSFSQTRVHRWSIPATLRPPFGDYNLPN